MRSNALRATRVYAGYYGCDKNTLFELCLLGKMQELPEYLFYHRLYPNALGAAMNSGRSLEELLFLDPGTNWDDRFSAVSVYRNYFLSVPRLVPSRAERLRCYVQLQRVMLDKSVKRTRRLLRHN